MIFGFTGTPGSGKTYDAVRKIIDNLRMGRDVFTNIDGLNDPDCLECLKFVTGLTELCLSVHLHFLAPDQVSCFWDHVVPGSLIVIDEAQEFFNSREWSTDENRLFSSWAAQARHSGHDLILITQDIMRIETSVRSLVQWTRIYRKVDYFGALLTQRYTVSLYAGQDTSHRIERTNRSYNDSVFRCYQSYISKDIKEMGVMRKVNVLRHPIIYAIPVVFGLFVYFFLNSGFVSGDLFGSKSIAGKKESVRPPESKQNVYKHSPHISLIDSGDAITFTNRSVEK